MSDNKPEFVILEETEIGPRRTTLVRVAALWPRKKGKGWTGYREAVALKPTGRVVVLPADRADEATEASEHNGEEQEVI
jgi:hypothetical protein